MPGTIATIKMTDVGLVQDALTAASQRLAEQEAVQRKILALTVRADSLPEDELRGIVDEIQALLRSAA